MITAGTLKARDCGNFKRRRHRHSLKTGDDGNDLARQQQLQQQSGPTTTSVKWSLDKFQKGQQHRREIELAVVACDGGRERERRMREAAEASWGSFTLPCRTSSRRAGNSFKLCLDLWAASSTCPQVACWVWAKRERESQLPLRLVFELADTLLALNIADRRHFGDINSCIKQKMPGGGNRQAEVRGSGHWQAAETCCWERKRFRVALSFCTSARTTCRSARNLIYAAGSRQQATCNMLHDDDEDDAAAWSGNIFIKKQRRTTTTHVLWLSLSFMQIRQRRARQQQQQRQQPQQQHQPQSLHVPRPQLLLSKTRRKFPTTRLTALLSCSTTRCPQRPHRSAIPVPVPVSCLWATCFMISAGDLLSFDLKSSRQDTHQ